MSQTLPFYKEGKTKVFLFIAFIATLISIAVLFVAYFGYFKPESELTKIWFQRSGAITCIFAFLASLSLLNIKELLFPSGMPSIRHNDFKKKYLKQYWILTVLSVFMTVLGTIVWGFGDTVFDL